ncbi:alpha-galactosidase [Streptococcus macedonicus]|uniref:Alpha-galactosidase n=1 Tax=Streptococcus macedonicus TaxID=59310 RepID=A0AA47IKM0_STRMC|nr:alpha-galactosidase [Streptococcus macedonicus]MCW8504950.1 alpha-galactosidase [Streptococcus macedonicus]MCW8516362.1 alpha-galactosidase [Streptococcus macedonicus]MCW8634502.1 alpha-galactosidase [Streptococcus macedonicus]MCW8643734.1 alpha-galactosidase [Streptococcus macedonicus]MCW8645917.1 alpha-galactosidase [Streptococcus macedonicus]
MRQGEFFHRYAQGIYQLYEKLLERYPNFLIEGWHQGADDLI